MRIRLRMRDIRRVTGHGWKVTYVTAADTLGTRYLLREPKVTNVTVAAFDGSAVSYVCFRALTTKDMKRHKGNLSKRMVGATRSSRVCHAHPVSSSWFSFVSSQPFHREPRMTLQKFMRWNCGSLSASTSAFTLPNVVSGLCLMPS